MIVVSIVGLVLGILTAILGAWQYIHAVHTQSNSDRRRLIAAIYMIVGVVITLLSAIAKKKIV